MVLEFLKLEFLEVLPPWHCWGGNWAIKKNYVVLEHGKLKYHATQYSSIPGSSTILQKNVVFFYFIFYFFKILELTKLEYYRKKSIFIIKWCSNLVYSSIVLHGTWVYHARVPHNFFLIAHFSPYQCHGGKTSRNSSLRNLSTIKSGISLYSSETVFFY